MNVEIGSTFVNGYAMNKSLSVIYKDLRDKIETNSIASKFVFADISELIPQFNVSRKYPMDAFKTFTNVAQVNIHDIAIVPAIPYDVKCAGLVPLIDVSTMTLVAVGLVKSVTLTDVELIWLEYITSSKQIVSPDSGNLIATGADGKLYLAKDSIEATADKVYFIDDDIQIVRVYDSYLDYNPSDIKELENVHDGANVIILNDPLHGNKPWLYVLSNTSAASPVIKPVGEYTKIKQYPSTVAVKSYVDSRVIKINKNFDNDTIVKNPTSELWGVALDRHTISKNKNGLYSVDLDVLREELLEVPSSPGNVVIFSDNGYIKDDGWGITDTGEPIDDGAKKLVSKGYLNSQRITDIETIDLIKSIELK